MNPVDYFFPARAQDRISAEEQAKFVSLVMGTVLGVADKVRVSAVVSLPWSNHALRTRATFAVCEAAIAAPLTDADRNRRGEWSRIFAMDIVRRVLPIVLRRNGHEAEAWLCENVRTTSQANRIAWEVGDRMPIGSAAEKASEHATETVKYARAPEHHAALTAGTSCVLDIGGDRAFVTFAHVMIAAYRGEVT